MAHVAPQNLSIYLTWKNRKQHYLNNKLKITAPMRNEEFQLPVGSYSVSDIQDYIKYIINTLNSNHQPLITVGLHQ